MMCEIYLKPDLASWGYNVFEASEGGVNGKDFCFPLFFFKCGETLVGWIWLSFIIVLS